MSRTKKQWRDLSIVQRLRIVLVGTVQLLLLVAALVDIRHRAVAEIKGGKRLWTALVFVNGIGPIAYFTLGRKHLSADTPEPLAA